MVFVRALAEAEREELKRLARREVGRVSERMRAILLSGRGYSVPQIAAIFECDEASVREWIRRFEAEGAAGLRDRPRSGRRRRATPAAEERIRRAVGTGPAGAGYPGGVWTVATLKLYIFVTERLPMSAATVRRLLLALGFRWRRPKLVLPADPEAARKMGALCERILAAADAVVLCLDECDLHLVPTLRAMWMPAGRQAEVMTPGTNRKRAIFGALAPETGAWHYRIAERKRAAEFLAFLEQLARAYPAVPLLLVLDNASIHTAKVVRAWLVEHPRVELCFLPSYAGHRENPVEKVWWRLKQQVAANRLYADIEKLVTAAREFLDGLTPAAALKLAA